MRTLNGVFTSHFQTPIVLLRNLTHDFLQIQVHPFVFTCIYLTLRRDCYSLLLPLRDVSSPWNPFLYLRFHPRRSKSSIFREVLHRFTSSFRVSVYTLTVQVPYCSIRPTEHTSHVYPFLVHLLGSFHPETDWYVPNLLLDFSNLKQDLSSSRVGMVQVTGKNIVHKTLQQIYRTLL